MPETLQALEPWIRFMPAWLLVLFRITGIFVFSPLFSHRAVPIRIKVFLTVTFSLCVFPLLLATKPLSWFALSGSLEAPLDLWAIAPAVANEMLIGTLIGYAAMIPLAGMQLGGHIASQQMGLGLAEVFSPGEAESGITSHLFYLVGLAVFVIAGGHRTLFRILVGSFDQVPLGGAIGRGPALDLIVGLLQTAFELGVRVAAPLLCLTFLQTVAMGFIARTVPQLNILSVGFVVRIILGVFVLVGSIAAAGHAFHQTLGGALQDLAMFLGIS